MKIAITHDYLRDFRGGEKVVQTLHEVWPDAPIYTAVLDREKMSSQGWEFSGKVLKTSFMQGFWYPLRNKLPRYYFTLFYPLAFLFFNFSKFDVIISSASYAAKYIRKGKSIHISYIHTPPRFLWGYDTDINVARMSFIERVLSRFWKGILKWIDINRADSVDFFIANSKTVQERIRQAYGREAELIYPPVETEKFSGEIQDKGYYLVISALGEYKKVDLVVKAFNELGLPLKVVGDGPQLEYLKGIAQSNVQVLGRLPDKETVELLLSCQAFIFPTEEDFGIAPVEAMAAGKPVLAYGKGGATETVIEGKTGTFFQEQTVTSLVTAIKLFDPKKYQAEDCRNRAKEFDKEIFKDKINRFVESAYSGRIPKEG